MYLTAHKVRNGQGQTGVNSFLYEDRERPRSDPRFSDVDPNLVQRTLVRKQTSIAPGGNTVLGYLDVGAADDTPPDRIQNAIDDLATLLDSDQPPLKKEVNGISVGFSITLGMMGEERQLLHELKAAIFAIMVQNPS